MKEMDKDLVNAVVAEKNRPPERLVRIRDGKRRTCFTVPDGGLIVVRGAGTYRVCFMDPTHFYTKKAGICSSIYHIDGFGELVNPTGTEVLQVEYETE
jgi:hypothetical protein